MTPLQCSFDDQSRLPVGPAIHSLRSHIKTTSADLDMLPPPRLQPQRNAALMTSPPSACLFKASFAVKSHITSSHQPPFPSPCACNAALMTSTPSACLFKASFAVKSHITSSHQPPFHPPCACNAALMTSTPSACQRGVGRTSMRMSSRDASAPCLGPTPKWRIQTT